MNLKEGKTERNFPIITGKDLYDTDFNIQQSSLATEIAIWFGVEDASPRILASQAMRVGIETTKTTGWIDYPMPECVMTSTRMHLSREQIMELLPILQRFVDTGELTLNEW